MVHYFNNLGITCASCRLEGNPKLCKFSSCNPKEKKGFLVPVIASISSVIIALVVVALFFVFRKKKVPSGESRGE